MPALYLIEFAIGAMFLFVIVTQVILPIWRRTPTFPWLEVERKLTNDLHDARQEVREAKIEQDISRTKQEKKKIKASTKRKKGW